MTNESILISEVIPATPQRIFSAWMDSAEHSAFTGDEATVDPAVGGEHRAAGGYIQGRTLELNEGARIVQSWRTTEFPPDSPDSRVEITLEPTMGGTLVTLLHTDIPVGQGDRYRQGWNEYYLSRLKSYFADVDQPMAARGGAGAGMTDDDDLSGDTDVESEVLDLEPTAESEAPTKVVKVPKIKATPKVAPPPPPAARAAAKPAKLAASAPAKKVAKTAARRPVKSVMKTAAKGAMKSMKSAAKRASTSVKKTAKRLMKGAAKVATRKPKAKAPKAAKGRAKSAARAKPSRGAAKKRGASSARTRRR